MPAKDLTGLTFNYWTVIKDSGERTSDRNILWLCKCKCGTEKLVNGSSLTRNKSKSCGCLRKEKVSQSATKNLINQRFDLLTVIKPTEQRTNNGTIIWECKCDCGNICYRSTNVLTRKDNEHHSCGCLNKLQASKLNYKNLTQKKFGKLLVLEETSHRKNNSIIWKCQCDCGNICYQTTNSLTSGNTQSCGCINFSIGEENIKKILDLNNLEYIKEWSIPALKLKRFDFALLGENGNINRLIEFDGRQHFSNLSEIWNSKETIQDIQKRDQEKNQWAKENNIPLVRIPYWERDNITLEMIMGDQYLI